MMDRRTASFSGVPVGRGTLIRSTTSRRSSWEITARRPRISSGTGFELGVEATSLMTATPVSSKQLREKRQQFGVERRRVAHVRGMAAVRDDDLPTPLHGSDQQVGLRLKAPLVLGGYLHALIHHQGCVVQAPQTGITLDSHQSIAAEREITELDGYVEDDHRSLSKGCFGRFHALHHVFGLEPEDEHLSSPVSRFGPRPGGQRLVI